MTDFSGSILALATRGYRDRLNPKQPGDILSQLKDPEKEKISREPHNPPFHWPALPSRSIPPIIGRLSRNGRPMTAEKSFSPDFPCPSMCSHDRSLRRILTFFSILPFYYCTGNFMFGPTGKAMMKSCTFPAIRPS